MALIVIHPGVAEAVPIDHFSALPSTTEAGGHPDVAFSFQIGNRQQEHSPCACDDAKDITVHFPTGLISNPHATPQCTVAAFASDECPVDSQVGVTEIRVSEFGEPYCGPPSRCTAGFLAPVFVIVPPPGVAALFGFKTGTFHSPIFSAITTRTDSDYGVNANFENTSHFLPLFSAKEVIWGVPSDPVHNDLRFGFRQAPLSAGEQPENIICNAEGEPSTFEPSTMVTWCPTPGDHRAVGSDEETGGPGFPVASSSPLTPFWQNPTTCDDPSLTASLNILGYDESTSEADSPYPATTDCPQLSFNPSLFARPTTDQTDSPSGIDVDLSAPSFESPNVPSPSEIRRTTITLPPGFTINPSAANGKSACTEAEARFGTTEEARCPQFAKVGTVEVHSAVLPGVLPGAIYLGQPQPGNRYRLFVTFDGFGIHVKLPGTVHPNSSTGQVIAEFDELPQSPFEELDLHFFGSERGLLATPTQCGTYPVATEFEPWDAALPDQTSVQTFTLEHGPNGGPCPDGPRPFAPDFSAASASNTAAARTSFSLDLTRQDGEQNLKALRVTTAPGFSAVLKGVAYCSEAAIAAASAPSHSGLLEQSSPSCPASSLIGEAIAGAGAGDHPFFAPGKVYLAGPYKGAPLSLVVITPAVAGPYDLGNVVVRAALQVNSETAQVTAVSDTLPEILEGIPLRLRQIMVNLNRPGFAVNPTNCNPFAVKAEVFGTEGGLSTSSSHFQVANCAALAFKPKLSLKFSGRTTRAGTPALKAVLTQPAGQANISRVKVSLPPSELIDNAHIGDVCTRPQFAAEACPANSVLGTATAYTPLLEKPLTGKVYLRSNGGERQLPDVVADLNGQIHIVLVGFLGQQHEKGSEVSRVTNTFATIPDAPVSKFVLQLKGGNKGLLQNSKNLCKVPPVAQVLISGQNGKSANSHTTIQTSCGSKAKAKSARRTNSQRRSVR